MSGEIQLIPPGLLGLMGVKNFGNNPSRLAEAYAPVLPMIPWAFHAKTEWQTGGTANQAAQLVGFVDFSTQIGATWAVPSNEWWYVEYMEVTMTGGAAADVCTGLVPAFQMKGTGGINFETALVPPTNFTNTGTIANRYFSSARDFWLPPGAILGCLLNRVFAAVGAISSGIQFTRLPI